MPLQGPISHPHEPSSSGLSSITSASYNDEGDATTVPQKYSVQPGPSAPSMQIYPHQGLPSQGLPSQGLPSQSLPSQGLPPSSMAIPSHQYQYPTSYNAAPWNQSRPG